MTSFKFLAGACAVGMLMATTPASFAGQIESACKQSDRRQATASLCSCIQGVANQLLTRRDQKLAATFFEDPHRAQEIRQSDNNSHEKFWLRYRQFGRVAATRCG